MFEIPLRLRRTLFVVRNPLIGLLGKKYIVLLSVLFIISTVSFKTIGLNLILKIILLAVVLSFFLFEWYLYITQKISLRNREKVKKGCLKLTACPCKDCNKWSEVDSSGRITPLGCDDNDDCTDYQAWLSDNSLITLK